MHGKHSGETFGGLLLSGIFVIYVFCRMLDMLSTGGNLKEVASLAWNMLIMCSPASLDKELSKRTF